MKSEEKKKRKQNFYIDFYLVSFSTADVECPVGWIEYDNFCYLVQDQTPLNYADAQAVCYGRNAALTSINSQAEQDFIFTSK